jgi:hypothetical protein
MLSGVPLPSVRWQNRRSGVSIVSSRLIDLFSREC